MIIEDVAEIVHNLNQQYCVAFGLESVSWEDADEETKASIMRGIENILYNDDVSPESSHNIWLEIKVSEGWTYGEKKDFKLKTHPNLVSFDKLPGKEKAKDYIFISIVKSLIPYLQGSEHRAAIHETGYKTGYTEAKEEIKRAMNKPYERRRS